MNSKLIFDFKAKTNLTAWTVFDDVVMGGKSSSKMFINKDYLGVFEGKVSLENNGGFSSLRYQFRHIEIKNATKIKIRLKGDGKDYQFRIKDTLCHFYSYITTFSTTTNWQDIEIYLKDMYPSFRGKRLDYPNFSNKSIEQIAFLIANKRDEHFKLLIEKIELV